MLVRNILENMCFWKKKYVSNILCFSINAEICLMAWVILELVVKWKQEHEIHSCYNGQKSANIYA